MTVGRKEGADLVLGDVTISRLHCRFDWKDGAYWVSDLGSSPGTYVGDVLTHGPCRLVDGDVIRIGAVRLRFELGAATDANPRACLLMLSEGTSPHARGARIDLRPARTLVGRSDAADVLILRDTVSPRHCVVEAGAGGYTISDTGTTNGTRVNGEQIRDDHLVSSGDTIHVADVRLRFLAGRDLDRIVEEEQREIRQRDPLTDLYGRAHLLDLLGMMCRASVPVALALADIDGLGQVNDRQGRRGGDAVIVAVARVVERRRGPTEIAGRFAGGAIALVMPQQNLAGAIARAEDLRRAVEREAILAQGVPQRVTVSVGVASSEGGSLEALLHEAGQAVQGAKQRGKNWVTGYPET
jgi:diguanylate cyclase (GGDEF)-like protein